MSDRNDRLLTWAERVIKEAEKVDLAIRLLGGLAVRLRCPSAATHPTLRREYKDLDFVVSRHATRAAGELLTRIGMTPNRQFNALHGASRMLYRIEEFQVDIFVGVFHQCHVLNLEPRLRVDAGTVPLADLLATKLQVVELNVKDVQDILLLLLDHPITDDDRGINSRYLSRLAAGDWGWYTTIMDNLDRVDGLAHEYLSPQEVSRVIAHSSTLRHALMDEPKGFRWRTRNTIGRRVQWYEVPEEAER